MTWAWEAAPLRLAQVISMHSRFAQRVIIAILLVICAGTDLTQGQTEYDELPPLYLTIIVHNEEDLSRGVLPKANIPDYDGDEAVMQHFASAMLSFAAMAAEHGARISFGSDWTFSRGVANYVPNFYAELEVLGHEVDAHAHESSVLYHEVREEIVLAGGTPTPVASGMNEETIQDQLAYFDAYYPEFVILWGVSLPGHGAGECTAAWVWRPSQTDWTQHDPEGKYIFIGHGEMVNSVQAVRQAVENRHPDRVNTLALFLSPREFLAAEGTEGIATQWTAPTDSVQYWERRIEWWNDLLARLTPLVDAGVVQYATLTQIADRFIQDEAALDFDWDHIPRSDAPLLQRNLRAGYPFGP